VINKHRDLQLFVYILICIWQYLSRKYYYENNNFDAVMGISFGFSKVGHPLHNENKVLKLLKENQEVIYELPHCNPTSPGPVC